MLAAFVLSLLVGAARRAARALAQAARRRRARAATARLLHRRRDRPRRVGDRDLVPAHRQHARAAPLPRQGHDRARIARRAAAGVGRDHRASRAARLPRSALDAARSGVRARPHVHVAVLHLRLDPAARRHGRAAGVDSSGARCCSRSSRCRPCCTSTWRPAVERAAQERGAQSSRLGAPPVHDRDDRAAGQGSARHRHRRSPGRRAPRGVGALVRPGRRGALGLGGVAHAGVGGLRRAPTSARSCSCRRALGAPPGDVLLVLAAGSRLSAYIGATVGEIGFLRGFWMDGSRRLAWLEDYAASLVAAADRPVPDATARRHPARSRVVRLSGHVAPGARRRVAVRCPPARSSPSSARTAPARRRSSSCWRRCTSRRRARSSSTTRRSRACRPTSGARGWPARSRTSSASSSAPATPSASATCRAWTTSRRSSAAVDRAGADDVVARLPSGLDTQLGPTWPGGVEVSFGQWQKLALARGFMRDAPAAAGARRADRRARRRDRARAVRALRRRGPGRWRRDGRITILVSHRFSTVRMADLIVVLDGARARRGRARTRS